ncbi:MAG: sigma factor-like helix-turn-helix DNA-binding protein, partial [Synechococcaceae cyanobacterium]
SSDGLTPELEALLAALPERQTVAVRLTVLEGISLRRAGEPLGVSRTTVRRAQWQELEALRLGLNTHSPSAPNKGSLP